MTPANPADDMRQIIQDALHHLDHVLPGQAPIHDFVHHNTLHGFQHLPFEQALREFSSLTGIGCYLPAAQFRALYAEGRIDDDDLNTVLEKQFPGAGETPLSEINGLSITRLQLYRLALLCDLPVPSPAQLDWQIHEAAVLERAEAGAEPARALWDKLLDRLELKMPDLHPEQLLDLSREQAESWLSASDSAEASGGEKMRRQARENVQALFEQVGENLSLRGLVYSLAGIDVLDSLRPVLIRWCASLLDEGMASWRIPQRQTLGLYQAWLHSADYDAWPVFQDLTDWQNLKSKLPHDAVEAIAQQLQMLGIPVERWPGYLQRLALELPGWSGLINWRQTHPNYQADDATRPLLADYLALRLILDRLYLQQVCREQWHCDARFDKLLAYFTKNSAEFAVRQALFQGQLPEYLAHAAQTLLADSIPEERDWRALAERIWTWQQSPLNSRAGTRLSVYNHGWRLFLACQRLGLQAADINQIGQSELLGWLNVIDEFDEQQRGYVWLNAYERHYQQNLLQALHANHDRGRWARRERRPQAQIIFCMDDREESFRRHLEELNPAIETLGAAGFFGVPMNYQGLDDLKLTPLCPVVVTPSHNVRECSQSNQSKQVLRHRQGGKFKQRMSHWLHHGLRREALLSVPALHAAAPLALAGLLLKTFAPKTQQRLLAASAELIAPSVETHLHFMAEDELTPATPEQPRLGFTDAEQTERIAAFLRNTGLTYGFAEWVVLMGHGSMSRNNPHLAAYDCGACSGRHGGPNARLFAAMANRPEIRRLLAERGISIPDDTWFIGAEHNTCDETITWFDMADIPSARHAALNRLIEQMRHAQRMSAHERCRRLASAPRQPEPEQALRHFLARSADFSQARPELGHATNAAALIGRRSLTQGAFFDRRLFLISYDPTQDPDGLILEGILLAVGPVGAGINLEYYFSTVNNERLGCGTKVPHNLTGFAAVMEGAGSDLRTGLPRQMIEIHEAMRLQIIVEVKTEILEQIYARQESLRELIGGGWVHVCAKDPDSGEIFVFERGVGFVPWHAADIELPLRNDSPDCYRDESLPVPAMLIKQPDFSAAGNG